jgi:long-chain acyl-CoA synthetase
MKLGMIPTHIKNEVYISYLPLAHMLERLVVNTCIINGYSIGYFQGNILKIKEDLAALKPTKFVSVPRLFNKFYSILSSKMNEKTGFTEKLVKKAVETKLKNLRTKGVVKHNLYDQLVFKKMKAVLGGRVSWMLSGGAPIAGEVLEMLQICFSCKIVEGYGQTETGASGCVTDLKETRSGNIGAPMLCCEVKLVDVAEMNYFSTDMVDGKNVPRGEICMKGPNVMDCYFQQKEKTEETIDKDGWLHTGDVGAIIEGGCVKIIDRMKNLFKMAQGEYVAVEKLENKYIQSPFVSQIFVYGNAYQHYLVAIIVPEQETVIKWADEKEAEQDYEGLCHNTDLKSDILDNMINLGREAKVKSLLSYFYYFASLMALNL